MRRLFASLAFAAGLTLLSVASYGQTPIASLPYTISSAGNYYLTQNLTYSGAAGNAITVNASNVTIDLNGYQLFCSNSNNSTWGIYANNVSNVSIKNGAIDGFTFGDRAGLSQGGFRTSTLGIWWMAFVSVMTWNQWRFTRPEGALSEIAKSRADSMASYSIMEQEIALVTT